MFAQAPKPNPAGPALRSGGVALTVFASQLMTSLTARQRVCGQLLNLLASGIPVSLKACDLGTGRHATDAFERVLSCVAACFDRSGLDPARVEVTVDAAAITPLTAWRVRRATVGYGVLNVLIPDSLQGCSRPCDGIWNELWQLQDDPVVAATWPLTTSPCPLLASEPAADVLPENGLQVPGQSAWLLAEIDVAEWLADNSAASFSRLNAHLTELVNEAERQHDSVVWPTAAMQYDSWANRRVGIEVRGIRGLLQRWSLDTNSQADLGRLDRLMQRVKQALHEASAELARTRELLPAIEASNPLQRLPGIPALEDWERRWQRAVRRHPLRHRNLLVLSPTSLIPCGDSRPGWLNLLRLLKQADACRVSATDTPKIPNFAEFLQFHRQLAAVRRHIEASRVVAERL